MAYSEDVNNYERLVNISEKCGNIFIDKVSEEDINQVLGMIPKDMETFEGTMKVHQWKWNKLQNNINFNEMSCYDCKMNENYKHFHLGKMQILRDQNLKKTAEKCK